MIQTEMFNYWLRDESQLWATPAQNVTGLDDSVLQVAQIQDYHRAQYLEEFDMVFADMVETPIAEIQNGDIQFLAA